MVTVQREVRSIWQCRYHGTTIVSDATEHESYAPGRRGAEVRIMVASLSLSLSRHCRVTVADAYLRRGMRAPCQRAMGGGGASAVEPGA